MSKNILNYCDISGTSVKEFKGNRKYIATGDILNNKIINFTDVNFKNKPSRANQNVEIGNIIFAKMKDTIKVIKITEENVNNIYSTGFYVIKPKENILTDYLYWLFNSPYFNRSKDKNCRGATQKALNNEGLKKIEISKMPDIKGQKNIIDILNKIQKVIDIKKQQIKEFEELIKSQFVEMFGSKEDGFKCDTIEFNKCIFSMLKGPFGSDIKKSLYVPKSDDTYKVYIQTNAIQNNQTLGDYYISKEYFDKKMYKFELKPLDYIVTCDGTIGKLLRLDNKMEKGIISSSLLKITLNEKISYKYFEEVWKQYMLGELSKSIRNACLTHLPSAKVIASLYIPFPSKELQIQYTKFVEEIDKQKLKIQKNLEQMQILQESLMNKYFY